MSATALLLLLAVAAPAVDDLARPAIEGALRVPGGRVALAAVEGASPRCVPTSAEAPRPITGSGRAPIRLRGYDATGQPCDGWAWAIVRVHAPALITTRALAEGEPIAGAVATVERELEAARPPLVALPDGARASRALAAGTPLDPTSIRVGPLPGDAVRVSLRLGPLEVDEVARATSCRPGRACAVLPSGRRVEGAWHEGRIVIEPP